MHVVTIPQWQTVSTGVGRVYGLIAVSALSALAVAAIKGGQWPGRYLFCMATAVPVAAFLQWNESWRSHDMAYWLLAEMRVGLFRQLEKLAPAYLLKRRSGDMVALATQDVETIEYFFAHMVAPAMVAPLVPATVIVCENAPNKDPTPCCPLRIEIVRKKAATVGSHHARNVTPPKS